MATIDDLCLLLQSLQTDVQGLASKADAAITQLDMLICVLSGIVCFLGIICGVLLLKILWDRFKV